MLRSPHAHPTLARRSSQSHVTPRCTFYLHRHANESQQLVSHSSHAAVSQMMQSVGVFTHLANAAAQAHDAAATLDYSCVSEDDSSTYPLPETQTATGEKDGQTDEAARAAASVHPVAPERLSACVSDSLLSRSTDASWTVKDAWWRSSVTRTAASGDPNAQDAAPSAGAAHPHRHSSTQRQVRVRQMELLRTLNPLHLPRLGYLSLFSSTAEYTALTACYRTSPVSPAGVFDAWRELVGWATACLLHGMRSDGRVASTDTLAEALRTAGESASAFAQLSGVPRGFASSQSRGVPAEAMPKPRTNGPMSTTTTTTAAAATTTTTTMAGSGGVSGVYVHRCSHAAFEFGIVTRGGQPSEETIRLLSFFMQRAQLAMPLIKGLLPIGAALRAVSLRLWWTPSEGRVTPHTPLPPIQVNVEELCLDTTAQRRGGRNPASCVSKFVVHHRPAWEEKTIFRGYEGVTLFLSRPITSQLSGTCKVDLPHSLTACGLQRPVVAAVAGGRAEAGKAATAAGGPPPVQVTQLTTGVVRATLSFADLSVSQTGEHMLAAEVRPDAAYVPFVPTLCGYVTPFLVVPASEAHRNHN